MGFGKYADPDTAAKAIGEATDAIEARAEKVAPETAAPEPKKGATKKAAPKKAADKNTPEPWAVVEALVSNAFDGSAPDKVSPIQARDTLAAALNDLDKIAEVIEANRDKIKSRLDAYAVLLDSL